MSGFLSSAARIPRWSSWKCSPRGKKEWLPAILYVVTGDRKSTRLNSSHSQISYAVFCLKKKTIRAPAPAQDLTLRHRVTCYRAGDLERGYASLDVHEDFFVNYGFVTRAVQILMHLRGTPAPWTAARGRYVRALLDFVRSRGAVHPREVDRHFSHGTVTNYWGGSSNATTHLLDAMHYRGLLRVVGREGGIRIYAAHEHDAAPHDPATRRRRLDGLVDVVVRTYAPLPAASLSILVRRLRYAVPQWTGELGGALQRAKRRLAHARVDG